MPHTCNTYCEGDVHVIRVLCRQPDDEDGIRQDYEGLGLEVLRIRPALECDLDAWRRDMTEHIETVNGRTFCRQLGQEDPVRHAMRYPYLLWARRSPRAEEEVPHA